MTDCLYELTDADIQAVSKLSELYDKYSPAIYRLVLSANFSPELAQQIMVKVYLATFRALRSQLFDFSTTFLNLRWETLKQIRQALAEGHKTAESTAFEAINRRSLLSML
ncbi:hypothetical protein EXU57_00405 [Segetibacter sp. 3557_3]|uniref:hypothetical protein n=1 Tax=Segetibacter sp. 3557_3 TaxID=2547429 RepID=UPI00105849F9|nr:hypothetical protein [Segetibacter sp. 3557_3]TDH28573.1 hypothetical protein EXU57_00405 [Segetibacter sp. 3557_3]